MKAFKKRFASKEVKEALDVLNEIGSDFDFETTSDVFQCEAFRIVQNALEDDFLADNEGVIALVKQGVSPRVQVYNAICNFAGDLVESGEYHIYRGVLNQVGDGLLKLFDTATDGLVREGAIDAKFADKQKAGVREGINSVG